MKPMMRFAKAAKNDVSSVTLYDASERASVTTAANSPKVIDVTDIIIVESGIITIRLRKSRV
jgi:hypothetical protein